MKIKIDLNLIIIKSLKMEDKSRVGSKWLEEEDNQLKKELEEYKLDYEQIANKHKRNITGIKARIISRIIYPKYINENIDLETLSNYYCIDINIIKKMIAKIEMKPNNNNNKETNKRRKERTKEEINNKLDIIIDLIKKLVKE